MSSDNHEQPPEQYVDIRTAADMLGVHYNTLRRWDKQGILPAKRTPTRNQRRWRRADIEAFLKDAA